MPGDPELLRSGVLRVPLDTEELDDRGVTRWGMLGAVTGAAPETEELDRMPGSEEPVRGAVVAAPELDPLPDEGGLLRGADTLGAALDPPEDVDRPALALEAPCECPLLLPPPPPRPPPLSSADAQPGAAQNKARVVVRTATTC